MLSSTKKTLNHGTIRRSMYTATNTLTNQSRLSRKGESSIRRSVKTTVRLIDANGVDYTPIPLMCDDKKLKDADKETPSDNISQVSFYTQSISSFLGTNPLGFTKSKSQHSSSGFTAESTSSMSDELVDGVAAQTLNVYTEVKVAKHDQSQVLKEESLDKNVRIVLEETDTIWIFDMGPTMFTRDCEESASIENRNKLYEVLLNSRVGNDKYVERSMNTSNIAQISKSVQTIRLGRNEVGCWATTWDIHDKYLEMAEEEKEVTKEDIIDINASPNATTAPEEVSKIHEKSTNLDSINPDYTSSKHGPGSRSPTAPDKTQETASQHSDSDLFGTRHSSVLTSTLQDSQARNDELMVSDKMQYSLFVMERALNMNCYFEKMLYYRELPFYKELMQEMKPKPKREITSDDMHPSDSSLARSNEEMAANLIKHDFTESQPHLELLWKSNISLTKGRNVSAFAWNRQNPDLLAVCYGEYDYSNQKPGLVCCWSLKNIDYPERIILLNCGGTAISWSKTHANLLAVGMFNGTILVFDVRKKISEPVIDTTYANGRHLGPVRQLEWVIRIAGRSEEYSEVLVSVSSDGRVTQWSIRKGFESSESDYHHDLMKLKRITTRIPGSGKQKKTDALISQYASGSCFAFNPKDANVYLAGVEEGHIHKCSCSYNEQYLDNFFGHIGPVYSIQWSPFMSNVFLSSSADWTIKLWIMDRQSPVINFQSGVKSVNSIAWSPKSSVIFACVNESAVEVWNLQMSTLDPLIMETVCPEYTVLTSVTFSESGDCLIVGDSDGILQTFVMRNIPPIPKNQVEALDKTIQSCIASQIQK